MIVTASAHSVRNALAAARRVAGLDRKTSAEVVRSGGEDGLYRSTLADGTVVEVTIIPHGAAAAFINA